MKVFMCGFLALTAFACLVRVEAGWFGGDDDDNDNDNHKRRESHYEGGFEKQIAHTLVDGAADRLIDMAEEKFDNPLIDAAIVGIGHKLKDKAHEEINEFGEDDNNNNNNNEDRRGWRENDGGDEYSSRGRNYGDDDGYRNSYNNYGGDDGYRNNYSNDYDEGYGRGRSNDYAGDDYGKQENFLSKIFRKK